MTQRTMLAGLVLVLAATVATASVPTTNVDATGPGRPDASIAAPQADDRRLPVECEATPEACAIGSVVAASLPYPWAMLDYDLVIRDPIDDWHAGRTRPVEQRLELFVDRSDSPESLLATFAHEVGHALHQGCNEPLLDAWAERRELPPEVPHHVDAPHDYDSVAEDYAEAFAQYLGFGPSRSTVGETVTQRFLQENADLFVPTVCSSLEHAR